MKQGGFFSFLTGLGIGLLTGVLYAPDKGENTRRRLTYQLDKYKKILEDYIKDISKDKNKETNPLQSESKKATEETIRQAEDLIKQVEDLTSKVKK